MYKVVRFKDTQNSPCEKLANEWLEKQEDKIEVIDFGTNSYPRVRMPEVFMSEIFIIYKEVE